MRVLPLPLDVAAERIGNGYAQRPAGGQVGKGVVEVVDGHLPGVFGVVDAAPGVDEPALVVPHDFTRATAKSEV